MEIKNMTTEELEARKAELSGMLELEDADLDAIEAEGRAINEELESRKAKAAKKQELRDIVAAAPCEVVEEQKEERKTKMENIEIRNTPEYIDAYAEYIKTGKDAECRALLSENVSGSVPIPTFVYDIVKTAWDREGIMSRVRKAYLKGNLKVGFEISGDDAVIHTEGGNAIDPENLVLGVVEIKPESIKKVIQISDEVYDLRGEAFLRYIYDELTYRIAKKAADTLVAKIKACPSVSTTTCPGVPVITATSASMGTVAEAVAQLSDEASNPVIMMNKLTWASFKSLQYGANYAIDPFEGLPVVFNSTITAYSVATTGVPYLIIGDLDHGALANFPNGEGIDFKFDELTLKKQDLIEVFGREYVGLGIVAPKSFVKVVK